MLTDVTYKQHGRSSFRIGSGKGVVGRSLAGGLNPNIILRLSTIATRMIDDIVPILIDLGNSRNVPIPRNGISDNDRLRRIG
jgi:hypothetical protein